MGLRSSAQAADFDLLARLDVRYTPGSSVQKSHRGRSETGQYQTSGLAQQADVRRAIRTMSVIDPRQLRGQVSKLRCAHFGGDKKATAKCFLSVRKEPAHDRGAQSRC